MSSKQLALPATEQFSVMSRILKNAGVPVERFASSADDSTDEERPQGKLSPMMTSASTEYLTPPRILDLVEKVGPIDLDPCGHPMAEATKRARNGSFILNIAAPSRPEKGERWINCDGLTQDWVRYVHSELNPRRGLAFINPPYGRALKAWAEKCATSMCLQIVLVPARTDTAWWGRLNPVAWCAVKGRLHFHGPDGQLIKDAAPFPSAVCLLHPEGDQLARFVATFSTVGIVYRRAV